jgi:hypothetical protein
MLCQSISTDEAEQTLQQRLASIRQSLIATPVVFLVAVKSQNNNIVAWHY